MEWYYLNVRILNEQNNEIYPQVLHMGLDYDYTTHDSIRKIVSNTYLNFKPNLNSFYLDPLTKLTDFVSQGYIYACGILASEHLSSVLLDFDLQSFQNFSAEVCFEQKTYSYNWIHFTNYMEQYIDFERSTFILTPPSGNLEEVTFKNSEELMYERKKIFNLQLGDLLPSKIVFENMDARLDLFFIHLTTRYLVISQQLREELIKNNFTGMEITPTQANFTFKT